MIAACPFCEIVNGTGPVSLVYEDDLTMAFSPLHPMYPGACIVIPKEHIDHFTDLPDEL
ncbi:MAG: HIT family protein, partial [Bacteroidota bacterium]